LLAQKKYKETPAVLYVLKEHGKIDRYFWNIILKEEDYKIIDVIANPHTISEKYSNHIYKPSGVFIFELNPATVLIPFDSLLKQYNIIGTYKNVYVNDKLILTEPHILLINPDEVSNAVQDDEGDVNIFTRNYKIISEYREAHEYRKRLMKEENEKKPKK
jgi:hypothetical protein